jgi:hypothetical protein
MLSGAYRRSFPMSKFLPLAAGLSCVGVLVLSVIALDHPVPSRFVFLGCTADRISPAEETGRSAQIDRAREAFSRRVQAREQIAEDVIAQRRSLAEAMKLFQDLDQDWPQLGPGSPVNQSLGLSEDEWYGRGVIRYVAWALFKHPDEAAAVVTRLENELQELLTDRTKRRPASAEASRGTVRREP